MFMNITKIVEELDHTNFVYFRILCAYKTNMSIFTVQFGAISMCSVYKVELVKFNLYGNYFKFKLTVVHLTIILKCI